MPLQLDLFAAPAPAFDAAFSSGRRVELAGDAWVEHHPRWVAGEGALFHVLERGTRWRHERREMYDRMVDVPRLVAALPDDGDGHPLLEEMRRALSRHYREDFARVSMALYRDGRDSVAWHGDTVARTLPRAIVATVSLGAPRRFLMRPAAGGASMAWNLGGGDLFVMGGSAQRTFRHSVPKVSEAGPRLAVMFRPVWER